MASASYASGQMRAISELFAWTKINKMALGRRNVVYHSDHFNWFCVSCFLFPVSCSVRYLVNVLCNSSQSQLYVKGCVIYIYTCRVTYSRKALVTTLPTVGTVRTTEK